MTPRLFSLFTLTLVTVVMSFSSGCTLKASTESVTDATTNFVSSTTAESWFTVDGLLEPSQKLNAFVAVNYETLQQEMAQGEGEYLTALGTLLEIPEERMNSFKAFAQEQASRMQGSTHHGPKDFVSTISYRN